VTRAERHGNASAEFSIAFLLVIPDDAGHMALMTVSRGPPFRLRWGHYMRKRKKKQPAAPNGGRRAEKPYFFTPAAGCSACHSSLRSESCCEFALDSLSLALLRMTNGEDVRAFAQRGVRMGRCPHRPVCTVFGSLIF